MLMLALRTDKPLAELYLYEDDTLLDALKWEAHRKLAETIHQQIDALLVQQGRTLSDVEKIGVYEGPGSFTGLRIGISVANTLAYSLDTPIVSGEGEEWLQNCLIHGGSKEPVTPKYGSEPHITKQKK